MIDTMMLPLLGGVLIGLSAVAIMASLGRIAGISGIVSGLLEPKPGDVSWRLLFVGGLLAGGLVMLLLMPGAFAIEIERSLGAVALAGLLVGFGTRLGSGCTSGHGVCGISRASPRSMVATATFIATGVLTVLVVRHVFGGTV